MNTIRCSSCGDATTVVIVSRDGSGIAGLWRGTCASCGTAWDFDD